MDSQVVAQVVVGAGFAYILQWVKKAEWFPWLTRHSTDGWKVIVSAVIAAASAFAIDFKWDSGAGSLMITGLTFAHAWNGLVAFGVSFLAQHGTYKALIEPKQVAKELAVTTAQTDKTLIKEVQKVGDTV